MLAADHACICTASPFNSTLNDHSWFQWNKDCQFSSASPIATVSIKAASCTNTYSPAEGCQPHPAHPAVQQPYLNWDWWEGSCTLCSLCWIRILPADTYIIVYIQYIQASWQNLACRFFALSADVTVNHHHASTLKGPNLLEEDLSFNFGTYSYFKGAPCFYLGLFIYTVHIWHSSVSSILCPWLLVSRQLLGPLPLQPVLQPLSHYWHLPGNCSCWCY